MKRIVFVSLMVLSASIISAMDTKENNSENTGFQKIGPGSYVIKQSDLSKTADKSQFMRELERKKQQKREKLAELRVQAQTRLNTAFNSGRLARPAILRSQLPGVSKKRKSSRKVRFQNSSQSDKPVQNLQESPRAKQAMLRLALLKYQQ